MSRRTQRVAEAVREVVSTAILLELRDPRIKNVTVLGAEVPGDLRSAKVSVSVMGGPKQEHLAMQGLQSATGYLQKKVGERLDLRYVPILSFKLDRGLQNAAETARILAELDSQSEQSETDTDDDEPPREGIGEPPVGEDAPATPGDRPG